jgi:hypothetical protein
MGALVQWKPTGLLESELFGHQKGPSPEPSLKTLAAWAVRDRDIGGGGSVLSSKNDFSARCGSSKRSALGVAIKNDSDTPVQVQLKAGSYSRLVNRGQTVTIPARSTMARFIHEVVTLLTDFVGQVFIESRSQNIAVMGLRFTEAAFTTIPSSARLP